MHVAIERIASVPVPNGAGVANNRYQRAHERTCATGRVAILDGADDHGLCRVHNLSDGGMMIKTNLTTCVGDLVRLSFDGEQAIRARVTWQNGTAVGLQFIELIDSRKLARDLALRRWEGVARQPRLPIDSVVYVTNDVGAFTTCAVNISQKGIKIRHFGVTRTGSKVGLRLECGIETHGVVKWSDGGFVGIELARMIEVAALNSAANLGRLSGRVAATEAVWVKYRARAYASAAVAMAAD